METFLRPVYGDFQPRHWFTLAVSFGTASRPTHPNTRLPFLQEWAVREYVIERTGRTRVRTFDGRQFTSPWSCIRARVRAGGLAWVFLMNASQTAPVSGLFDWIDRGDLILSGKDPRDTSKDWSGYAVMEDPPFILLARYQLHPDAPGCQNATVKIVDVRNYGLECWADCVNNGEPSPEADWDTFASSAERYARLGEQTECLGKTVQELIRLLMQNGLGGLQTTSSAQSMYSFRRAFLREPIFLHRNTFALDLERDSYYGGRCELYQTGRVKGPVYHLDFQSFYPSCCVGTSLPCCLAYHVDVPTLPQLAAAIRTNLVIAEVTVSTSVPAFPLRLPGRTVWPVGRFKTALCGPELALAHDLGAVKAVHRMNVYDGYPVLSAYSLALWSCRKAVHLQHGRAATLFLKKLLTGITGKFGQTARRWIDCPEDTSVAPYLTWYERDENDLVVRKRAIGWKVQREDVGGETGSSCPAIAAWITSEARARLWRAILIAGRSNVYYIDTDSLHVNRDGLESLTRAGLVQEGVLGKLRLVLPIGEATYHSLKHYQIADVVKCSGSSAPRKLSCLDEYIVWTTETLSDNLTQGQRPLGRARKSIVGDSREYQHGRVTTGGRIEPLVIMQKG